MTESARELFPVTFMGNGNTDGMTDFKPHALPMDIPEPQPEDLEKIEEAGLDVPVDPDQLALDLEGIVAVEVTTEPTPVAEVEDVNKGKVPPA